MDVAGRAGLGGQQRRNGGVAERQKQAAQVFGDGGAPGNDARKRYAMLRNQRDEV